MTRTLALLLSSFVLVAQAAAQCEGTRLGRYDYIPGAVSVAGDRLATVVRNGLLSIDRVDLHELQPDGSLALVGVAEGFEPITGFTRSITFDGERVQVATRTNGCTLYELERDATGAWTRHELQLTAPNMGFGRLLARDGDRFAFLGFRNLRTMVVDVIERNAAGRLEVVQSLDVWTRNAYGHDVSGGIDLDGDRIVFRSGAEQRDAATVVERHSSGVWYRAGHLLSPPNTNSYYLGAVAVQGDVCAMIARVLTGTDAHVVNVYERDAAQPTGWVLAQQIPVADSIYGAGWYRYIASIELEGDRLVIGQVNSGLTQVLRRAAGGPLRFDLETTIHGLGRWTVVSDELLAGFGASGDYTVFTTAELAGRAQVTVCIPAGVPDCIDPAHTLTLDLWKRRVHEPHPTTVADLRTPVTTTGAAVIASPVYDPIVLPIGLTCTGAVPRRSVIPMPRVAPGRFEVSIPWTRLPVAMGTATALDGETWWVQGVSTSGGPRELSSAVRIEISL